VAFSVFLAEAVGAEDFYEGRTDGFAANEVLKIQQVRSSYRIVFDVAHLSRTIADATSGDYDVLHISAHGDDTGISLTNGDFVSWYDLARMLKPFGGVADKPNKILVVSSCMGGYVGLSKALQKRGVAFRFIFGSTARSGVGFTHSCIAWSIPYNRFVELGSRRFTLTELRTTLDRINQVVPGDFVYRRWNGSVYLHYPRFADQP
jgi:hypothetical protein